MNVFIWNVNVCVMNRKIKDQYSDDNCICQAHKINSECVRHGTKKD